MCVQYFKVNIEDIYSENCVAGKYPYYEEKQLMTIFEYLATRMSIFDEQKEVINLEDVLSDRKSHLNKFTLTLTRSKPCEDGVEIFTGLFDNGKRSRQFMATIEPAREYEYVLKAKKITKEAEQLLEIMLL